MSFEGEAYGGIQDLARNQGSFSHSDILSLAFNVQCHQGDEAKAQGANEEGAKAHGD